MIFYLSGYLGYGLTTDHALLGDLDAISQRPIYSDQAKPPLITTALIGVVEALPECANRGTKKIIEADS